MTLQFQPLGAYALVSLLPSPPTSTIIDVQGGPSLTQRAVVKAVGPGLRDLAVGDVVYCRPIQGHAIGDDLLLPSTAILATETA